jgi:hypothetical protein
VIDQGAPQPREIDFVVVGAGRAAARGFVGELFGHAVISWWCGE